jgi:serine/threonine protein kinase
MSSGRWERTKEILEQALRLAPQERQAYLGAACGADADLRCELESLIASYEEAGSSFLGADASEVLQLTPSRALSSGTKVGRYELIELLGAGGMGEVYRARDARLDRLVAIKILPAAFSADRERLHRFEQEARSASGLNHPNIVTIYELGQDHSCHYIAMELVEGKTLRELLGSSLLPMRKAIEIGAQIAEGLTKAHEAGITHRDLKPENIMVSHDGFVKILDFGLAKFVSSGGGRSDMYNLPTSQTPVGLVLGTMGYMSPEQVSGDGVDFRSDQFSLGLVLYEMVTGKRAFQRSTAAETLWLFSVSRPNRSLGKTATLLLRCVG